MNIPEKLHYDLKKDLEDYCVGELTKLQKRVVNNDPVYSYLLYYEKFISLRPRKIVKSKQFSPHLRYIDGLKSLEDAIENGGDLNLYQSKGYDRLNEDQMYNEWGIRHFHLGEKVDSKTGKIERTEHVLFAIVTHNTVYFIQVKSHKSFSSKIFLEIVDSNWPELIKQYLIDDSVRLFSKVGSKDRHKLRKAGVISFTQLKNGKIYMPTNGGYATNGSSNKLITKKIELEKRLSSIEKNLDKNRLKLAKDLQIDESIPLSTIRIHLDMKSFFEKEIVLFDEYTKKKVVVHDKV